MSAVHQNSIRFPFKLETANGELVINLATSQEAEEITTFIEGNIVQQRPSVHLAKYDSSPDARRERYSYLLDTVHECLKYPLSMTVRESKTGQLVAIRMNKLEANKPDELDAHSSTMPDHLLFSVLDGLGEGIDLFKMYKTDRVLHLFAVGVLAQYGRQGLASRLYQLSIELAISAGVGAMAVDAFSEYAYRAASKLGFTVLRVIEFATYEYKGGTPLADCGDLDHSASRYMARPLP